MIIIIIIIIITSNYYKFFKCGSDNANIDKPESKNTNFVPKNTWMQD